nr:MAG TPA: repressor protein [Caudoviricetes sp.]
MIKLNYGQRLKSLRESKDLSQQELADRLKINRSTYARYELGQTQPDFDTLQKLADYFDVSTDYILGRTNDPSTKDDSEKGEMYFFDKENVTPDEMRDALAYIKARRMLEKQSKKRK